MLLALPLSERIQTEMLRTSKGLFGLIALKLKAAGLGRISLQVFVLLLSLRGSRYPSLLILAEAEISQLIRAGRWAKSRVNERPVQRPPPPRGAQPYVNTPPLNYSGGSRRRRFAMQMRCK